MVKKSLLICAGVVLMSACGGSLQAGAPEVTSQFCPTRLSIDELDLLQAGSKIRTSLPNKQLVSFQGTEGTNDIPNSGPLARKLLKDKTRLKSALVSQARKDVTCTYEYSKTFGRSGTFKIISVSPVGIE